MNIFILLPFSLFAAINAAQWPQLINKLNSNKAGTIKYLNLRGPCPLQDCEAKLSKAQFKILEQVNIECAWPECSHVQFFTKNNLKNGLKVNISNVGPEALKELQSFDLNGVSELHLMLSNYITNPENSAPLSGLKIPNVKVLNFSNSNFGDYGIKALSKLKLPSLQVLDLTNTKLSQTGLLFVNLMSLMKLTHLYIGHNPFDYISMQVISNFSLPNLKYLDLSSSNISSSSLKYLNHMKVPKLRCLDISGNGLFPLDLQSQCAVQFRSPFAKAHRSYQQKNNKFKQILRKIDKQKMKLSNMLKQGYQQQQQILANVKKDLKALSKCQQAQVSDRQMRSMVHKIEELQKLVVKQNKQISFFKNHGVYSKRAGFLKRLLNALCTLGLVNLALQHIVGGSSIHQIIRSNLFINYIYSSARQLCKDCFECWQELWLAYCKLCDCEHVDNQVKNKVIQTKQSDQAQSHGYDCLDALSQEFDTNNYVAGNRAIEHDCLQPQTIESNQCFVSRQDFVLNKDFCGRCGGIQCLCDSAGSEHSELLKLSTESVEAELYPVSLSDRSLSDEEMSEDSWQQCDM